MADLNADGDLKIKGKVFTQVGALSEPALSVGEDELVYLYRDANDRLVLVADGQLIAVLGPSPIAPAGEHGLVLTPPSTDSSALRLEVLPGQIGNMLRIAGTAGAIHVDAQARLHLLFGTLSDLSLKFVGDSDTGIYRPSSNTVALVVGGEAVLTTDTSEIRATVPIVDIVETVAMNAGGSLTSTTQGRTIEVDSTINRALNILSDAIVNHPIGTVINICRLGTGTVTVTANAGVTLRKASATTELRAQNSEATLRKRAANDWVLSGDLA